MTSQEIRLNTVWTLRRQLTAAAWTMNRAILKCSAYWRRNKGNIIMAKRIEDNYNRWKAECNARFTQLKENGYYDWLKRESTENGGEYDEKNI